MRPYVSLNTTLSANPEDNSWNFLLTLLVQRLSPTRPWSLSACLSEDVSLFTGPVVYSGFVLATVPGYDITLCYQLLDPSALRGNYY